MNILMVTNKVRAYSLGHKNVIEPLLEIGHQVIWAADFNFFIGEKTIIPCKIKQISINTSPWKLENRMAYKQLLQIIDDEQIEAIYCSTPIGGLLARIAGRKKGISPIIYAAHGFLFFKGAPWINRTVYKWEELILAHYTDALINITKEDYNTAQKFKLRSGRKPYLVHGAGVNIGAKITVDKVCKRKELGISDGAFIIVSAGELNKNKNIKVMIEAVAELQNPNIQYIICGEGDEYGSLIKLVSELNICNQIHFLGFRMDVLEIMAVSDAFVMPSFREGVPRALLEAMDLGLPCVASRTRGIMDLIEDGVNGYLCKPHEKQEFVEAFRKLIGHPERCSAMGNAGRKIAKGYSKEIVREELTEIFKEVLIE